MDIRTKSLVTNTQRLPMTFEDSKLTTIGQVRAFINTPFAYHEQNLRELGLGACQPTFSSFAQEKYLKFFRTPADDAYMHEYVERCHRPASFSNAPVLELACYIYSRILLGLKGHVKAMNLRLLTFAISVDLAQKFLFDRETHPKSMSKLLGLPPRDLYKREIFILRAVFDLNLDIDTERFQNFRDYLGNLGEGKKIF